MPAEGFKGHARSTVGHETPLAYVLLACRASVAASRFLARIGINAPTPAARSSMSDVAVFSGRTQIAAIVDALLARKKVRPGVGADEDLHDRGLTSLDMVNLMLAVEDAFDIEIPQREMTPDNFRSIAAVEQLVGRLVA
jgi:acyl carrier protein